MKILISFFSVLILLSSQGLTHACFLDLTFHQNDNAESHQDHECCQEQAATDTESQSCGWDGCFETFDFEITPSISKGQEGSSDWSHRNAYVESALILSLQYKKAKPNKSTLEYSPPRSVPIYLTLQALRIPSPELI